MLDHPWFLLQAGAERAGIGTRRDRAIEDQVALVGQVGLAGVVGAQLRVGQERGQPPARVAPAEAHHLHGEARVLAQALDELRRLGDHHEPARGRDHDLLAQERAAAALDQPEPRVHLVGAVQGEVERRLPVQLHDLDARRGRELARALGGHRGADAVRALRAARPRPTTRVPSRGRASSPARPAPLPLRRPRAGLAARLRRSRAQHRRAAGARSAGRPTLTREHSGCSYCSDINRSASEVVL